MDLKRAFRRTQSKSEINKIVHYVGNNPHRFKVLVNVFLAGPFRVTQRVSWPLTYCAEIHPELIKPHLKTLLDHLKKPGLHNTWKRNTIRLLQFIDIPKRHHARVTDICFQYFKDKREAIGIRVFSMTVLGRMAHYIPELKQEITILIEDQLPYASAAFLSRARKVLKELRKAPM